MRYKVTSNGRTIEECIGKRAAHKILVERAVGAGRSAGMVFCETIRGARQLLRVLPAPFPRLAEICAQPHGMKYTPLLIDPRQGCVTPVDDGVSVGGEVFRIEVAE